jgi:glycosyltransferase involved in cell wall biosynthesis
MIVAKDPTVSVLIATYNKASTLHYAVQSVLAQTLEDFELWVIGDGCTDNSGEVVAGFRDPRVHWYNLPQNTGYQSEPHNEGLRRAKGRFVAYLNHDDIWLPNHLASLVNCLEESGAEFAYSIMEWVLTYAECYADIPFFPNAPRPPEASATIHLRSVVDEIGFWRPPHETHSVPRADYFRRAQLKGMRFELVPMLTVLKFGGTSGGYSAVGEQPDFMDAVSSNSDFVQRRLAGLLVQAYRQLERPPTPKGLIRQWGDLVRRQLIKRGIDPAILVPWRRPGWHIRLWRRQWRLDDV